MKNSFLKSILLLPMLLFLSSCRLFPGDKTTDPAEQYYLRSGYQQAKVIEHTVDGCSWMLELNDGKKLQPLNLLPEFQKKDLKVWVSYQPEKNTMSICMAGEMITITAIEKRTR